MKVKGRMQMSYCSTLCDCIPTLPRYIPTPLLMYAKQGGGIYHYTCCAVLLVPSFVACCRHCIVLSRLLTDEGKMFRSSYTAVMAMVTITESRMAVCVPRP